MFVSKKIFYGYMCQVTILPFSRKNQDLTQLLIGSNVSGRIATKSGVREKYKNEETNPFLFPAIYATTMYRGFSGQSRIKKPVLFGYLSFNLIDMRSPKKIPEALIRQKSYIKYMEPAKTAKEKACLVGLARKSYNKKGVETSLRELAELTVSAGGKIAEKIIQTRTPDPKYYIGKGMVEKIKADFTSNGTNLVIFDEPLSPAQQRNLEESFGVKVIDRSILILDIFALHARTSAAKLQVELAQLEYMLPRLTGAWQHFSRQYGGVGIGTKGPGETQLEIDRRQVRKKIAHLKKEIERLGRQRETQRKRRQNLFKVAFIGYTNAGKSTLFNKLTKSEVTTADALFTTLDSTTRMMSAGYPEKIIFTDTVGFIKKLPHQLVASFKSTLEEVVYSDLLLQLVDISDENYQEKTLQTESVLREIGAGHLDKLLIYNKIDKLISPPIADPVDHNSFYISALENIGLDPLRQELSERLRFFCQKQR